MNRSKQSKNGYIFDMFIFSCIRVKRRIEREREKKRVRRREKMEKERTERTKSTPVHSSIP